MRRGRLRVWLGGTPLSFIGPHMGMVLEASVVGGCTTATWKMQLPATFDHPLLVQDTPVTVRSGGNRSWGGKLRQPTVNDDGTWTFKAVGLSLLAGGGTAGKSGFLCFDAAFNATSVADEAIDQARARGWGVLPRTTSISATPFAEAADMRDLNYVGNLLDELAQSRSQRWGVDPDYRIWMSPVPTTPTYHVAAGATRLGWNGDNYVSAVFVRYQIGAASFATAPAYVDPARKVGTNEVGVDALRYGTITTASAQAIADGIRDAGRGDMELANTISPNAWQLTTPGRTPVSGPEVLARVGREPVLLRLDGIRSPQGRPLPYYDVVAGVARWDDDAERLTLTAGESLARDNWRSLVAQLSGAKAA